MRSNRTRIAAVLVVHGMLCACGGRSPSAPSVSNVAGVWAGDLATVIGTLRVVWTLSQSGPTVSGPVVLAQGGFPVVNGTLSGTMEGSTLNYTITIPAGGISFVPTCSGQIQGSMALASAQQMSGKFTGTSTCNAPIGGGDLTLTKQ